MDPTCTAVDDTDWFGWWMTRVTCTVEEGEAATADMGLAVDRGLTFECGLMVDSGLMIVSIARRTSVLIVGRVGDWGFGCADGIFSCVAVVVVVMGGSSRLTHCSGANLAPIQGIRHASRLKGPGLSKSGEVLHLRLCFFTLRHTSHAKTHTIANPTSYNMLALDHSFTAASGLSSTHR